ncbi:MAG: GTPase-activating protein S13 [Piccolia ochrophora]|nr:MAG: GTPase-activating protein S13 [Piccolia ochrophora]
MAQVISNAGHDDMVHDAVLDYYGRRLATCSSDRTIKIFEIDGETHRLTETLKGYYTFNRNPNLTRIPSQAHPKYGNILASAGYDGKVFIWREQGGQWQKVFDFALHTASVNMVSWAPHEAGCLLACASSDGSVSVLEFKDNSWDHQIFPAHGIGVNAVSWAPALTPGSLVSSAPATGAPGGGAGAAAVVRRFVTGGSDNLVKIWDWSPDTKTYTTTQTLTGHTDWVRDVAWSPTLLHKSYIATASQDKTVRIWTTTMTAGAGAGAADASAAAEWKSEILPFESVLWRVSWSLSGNVLAVSGQDNVVGLWKEGLKGGWECVKTVEE